MPVRNDFAPGEFCWIDLAAHDSAAAQEWYGALFGWSHFSMETGGGPPYAFFMNGDSTVGGVAQMADEMQAQGIPPMWNSYICTQDCAATEARVKEIGGTVTVPTMEVPGHGKLAFFLDPEGASFAAWQTTNVSGPGVMVQEPGSLSWNELMTRDSAKASKFYGELVGWDFAPMPMGDVNYTMIKNADKDAGGMMAMEGPHFEGIPAHWLVYFAVVDCDATAAKAGATGGKVNVPPTDIPVGKFSILSDPQGAVFGVITLKASPQC
ncbi:MAG: VOC family protein [bacterium]|nr:VOC family protein [bacterium]